MSGTSEDPVAAITEAVGRVRNVRNVSAVRFAREEATGRSLVALRIGLPPALPLLEIVTVIAHVQLAAARLAPRGSAVFVEPDVAADQATPTEAIVIRGLE
jgi:divalent metal cation (Fe/Co/Zn/Cd) transporter